MGAALPAQPPVRQGRGEDFAPIQGRKGSQATEAAKNEQALTSPSHWLIKPR